MQASRKISVVIPTIGRLNFLDKAVASLINQNLAFDEILVFDNSKEQNLRSLSAYSEHPQITWTRSQQHVDALTSWNTAVSQCRNEFVTIFGDDDLALTNFHNELQKVLERSDFGLIPFNRIDQNDQSTQQYQGAKGDIDPAKFRHNRIRGKQDMVVPGVIFNKTKFDSMGGFVDVGLPNYLYPDELLWLKLASLEKSVAIGSEPVWLYRVHDSQIGGMTSIEIFSKNIGNYLNMLTKALMNNGVQESEIFPPGLSRQKYLDKIQLRYLRSVTKRLIKKGERNKSIYMNELRYFMNSDASFLAKLEGAVSVLWKIFKLGKQRIEVGTGKNA